MKPLLRSVLGLALLLFWQAVDAHPGGLNAQGCHNNRKTGGYHCHRSQTPAIEVPRRAKPDLPKAGVVKKSRSGICHTPQSPYYARTTNYQSFDSLESCLQNGGRLPKGQTGAAQSAPPVLVAGGSRQSNASEQYDRSRFGGWIDADGDCLDTRQELLVEKAFGSVEISGCKVIRGSWVGAYSGEALGDPADVDVDHVIPLKWSWDRGANGWDRETLAQFANDRNFLRITSASVNRAKGSKGPEEWLPPDETLRCAYLSSFIDGVFVYGLEASNEERAALLSRKQEACEVSYLGTNSR